MEVPGSADFAGGGEVVVCGCHGLVEFSLLMVSGCWVSMSYYACSLTRTTIAPWTMPPSGAGAISKARLTSSLMVTSPLTR